MRKVLAAQKEEEAEQARRLAGDDSKQRALRDMMNATLETRKKSAEGEDALVRACVRACVWVGVWISVCVWVRVCVCVCVFVVWV